MIQCPNCFSWINDVSEMCENCGVALVSFKEPSDTDSHAAVNAIPALGQSVRGMIAGMVAAYLSPWGFLTSLMLLDAGTELSAFISNVAFVAMIWIASVVTAVFGLRSTLAAEAKGNGTRMIFTGKLLCTIAFTVAFFVLVLIVIAIVRYLRIH